MPDEPTPLEPAALQFEHAEFATPATVACAACRTPIATRYYEANGQVVCDACAASLERGLTTGTAAGRWLRAAAFGSAAAVAGAVVWYAVRELVHLEIGLIAIGIGMLVGTAVHKGARGHGGWPYQILAVVLTYVSIVSASAPYLVAAFQEGRERHRAEAAAHADTPDAVADADAPDDTRMATIRAVVFVGVLLASPFLTGFDNIIGWLIIFFGLQQAWRLNRRLTLTITGPFPIGATG